MNQSFDLWMKQVDENVQSKVGCSVYDLPDCCFADWFESGMNYRTAANMAIKAGGMDI